MWGKIHIFLLICYSNNPTIGKIDYICPAINQGSILYEKALYLTIVLLVGFLPFRANE